jgi:histidinol phosphatase-like PHP family hydrolase
MQSVRDLVEKYMGGLAHVHTRLSNHPGHVESDQSLKSFVDALVEYGLAGHPASPLRFVMINDHVSNPVRPRLLSWRGLRARLLKRRTWRGEVLGVPVYYGFEASMLPDGAIDLPWQLAEHSTLVIASRHRIPADIEQNARALHSLFERACTNPVVDVLGHPARNIEGLRGMDWPGLFALAADTGTAVEVNLNTYPDERREPARAAFWTRWLSELERSEADVFFGADIHNTWQRERFIQDWRTLSHPQIHNQLASAVQAVARAGIKPERVVTADAKRFADWLGLDKRERRHLVRARLGALV